MLFVTFFPKSFFFPFSKRIVGYWSRIWGFQFDTFSIPNGSTTLTHFREMCARRCNKCYIFHALCVEKKKENTSHQHHRIGERREKFIKSKWNIPRDFGERVVLIYFASRVTPPQREQNRKGPSTLRPSGLLNRTTHPLAKGGKDH